MLGSLLRGAFALAVMLIGLQTIGHIFAVALDTDDVFFLVLGMGVALLIAGGALFLITLVASLTLVPIAAGWLGMFVGQHPHGFGSDDNNRMQALGSLLLIVLFSFGGYSIWSHGHELADPFQVVSGLLIVAGAWIVGLAEFIPRVYFTLRPGEAEGEAAEEGEMPTLHGQAQQITMGLVVCVMAGMGLAKCTALRTGDLVDTKGRLVLSYGDWIFACVDKDAAKKNCASPRLFTIRPTGSQGQRIRLTLTSSCPEVEVTDDAGNTIEALDEATRMRLKIPPNGRGGLEHNYLIFDNPANEQYTITVSAGDAKDSCDAGIRYTSEPTSGFRERVP